MAQTFADIEVLVVDDGSADGSGAICDEYAQQDSRVRVFHKKNGGVSSARNLALDVAQGEYLSFCDSDDFVEETWIERLYSFMKKEPIDVAICGYNVRRCETDEVTNQVHFGSEQQVRLGKQHLWELRKALLCLSWNKMFRMDVIQKQNIRFEEGVQYGEDELFVLAYLSKTEYRIMVINEHLYNYRSGVSGGLTDRYLDNAWNVYKHLAAAERRALQDCHISIESIHESYYNGWAWYVLFAVQNNLKKDSGLSFREMLIKNNAILNSEEAKEAFDNSDFKMVTPLYKHVLQTKSAMLLWVFHKVVAWKHMISKG